ncbi:MAG: nucleotidyl transferase AbiEii/AbiGii toxin family protein [Enterococcus sp.]|nr:nucleotidyl transferase AbiEii/AbiGii toxin family protein [Enterococcus sp.]
MNPPLSALLKNLSLTYSPEDQLADKFCAIVERQNSGFPSSRMKDLVDVVFLAKTCDLKFSNLSLAVVSEAKRRGFELPRHFEAPRGWSNLYENFAKKNGVDAPLTDFDTASSLASDLFDPVLEKNDNLHRWNPEDLAWE